MGNLKGFIPPVQRIPGLGLFMVIGKCISKAKIIGIAEVRRSHVNRQGRMIWGKSYRVRSQELRCTILTDAIDKYLTFWQFGLDLLRFKPNQAIQSR